MGPSSSFRGFFERPSCSQRLCIDLEVVSQHVVFVGTKTRLKMRGLFGTVLDPAMKLRSPRIFYSGLEASNYGYIQQWQGLQ